MGVGLEAETTFQDKLKRIWSNLVNWGVNNQEEFLFVGQFCSSPYITKFTRDEVMKEYVFLHNFVDEGIKTGEVRDFPAELVIAMFYQGSREVVNLILDSDSSLDKNKIIADGFQILWRGSG